MDTEPKITYYGVDMCINNNNNYAESRKVAFALTCGETDFELTSMHLLFNYYVN